MVPWSGTDLGGGQVPPFFSRFNPVVSELRSASSEGRFDSFSQSTNADSSEHTDRCPCATNNSLIREMLLGLPVSELLGGRSFA